MSDNRTDEEIRFEMALKSVMSTEQGRDLLWWILSECGIYQTTFDIDHAVSSFKEGQRNIGLTIFGKIQEYCPELYLLAQSEQTQEDEQESENVNDGRSSRD